MTVENVQNENLRLLYVAMQSADIDLKINNAINETMKIYRYVLGTGTALGYIPTAALIHLNFYAILVCKAIVQCFGLPRVSHRTVYEIVKGSLWDDLDHDFSVITPNSLSAVYLTSAEVAGTALTAGLLNIPLVLVVTTRLILILATDLILTLIRGYLETTAFPSTGNPPALKDVENAAAYYRNSSSKVHKEILGLVPSRKLTKTYRYHKIRLGLEEVLHRWQAELTKDPRTSSSRSNQRSTGRKSFSSDRTLVEDNKAEADAEGEAAIDEMSEVVKATKLN